MLKKLLIHEYRPYADHAYALVRIIFGLLLVQHGWDKITNFESYVADFPDPLGLGPQPSLLLAIFAEFFCGIMLALGFMVRLAAFPVVITFVVAFFVVHMTDPFQEKELALFYLLISLYCLLRGAGDFSVDKLLYKLHHENS